MTRGSDIRQGKELSKSSHHYRVPAVYRFFRTCWVVSTSSQRRALLWISYILQTWGSSRIRNLPSNSQRTHRGMAVTQAQGLLWALGPVLSPIWQTWAKLTLGIFFFLLNIIFVCPVAISGSGEKWEKKCFPNAMLGSRRLKRVGHEAW